MNPGLLDANVDDEESIVGLFDSNEQIHRLVQSELGRLGIMVASYPMSVQYPPDAQWLEAHALEHMSWSLVLNLDDPGGLNQYDLNDKAQFAQWVSLHARHHQLVNATLNL